MAKNLIIVESPTKARTITKYLGRGYTVMASVGHVKDLPTSKLGVDLENDFEPQYVTIKGKSKVLSEIKKKAEEADKVFLAPDPDREGEAIAWHLEQELLGKSKKKKQEGKIFRVLFNEITQSAIKRALQSPGEIDMNLVNAQQARRVLDRIVGYQGSQLLWNKVRRGLSMGRVQSVAMRLICEREAEREAFRTEEYWSIIALLAGTNPPSFEAKLHSIDGGEASIENAEQAGRIVGEVQGKTFVVQSIERREKRRNPVAPFITSRLQQEASRKLHFSPKKTMTLAQQLYEGIEIGAEGATGLITYMRTDSPRISNEAMADAREVIQARFGTDYLPATPNVYKTSKAAQEAHEAIRPTSAARDPESIRQYLEHDQYNLYKLIWNRFIASQMVPAILDVTRIDSSPVGTTARYIFRSTGTVVKFPGHTIVYMEGVDKEAPSQKPKADQEADDDERQLPALSEGERLRLVEHEAQTAPGLLSKQHFTQPPPRYNEALLIKELEEKGIGRPSTYAAIISTIQDRKYVEKTEGRLVPTETGKTVNDFLLKGFPQLINVDFTSQLEEQLDAVEEGNKQWVAAVRDFYAPFTMEMERAKTIPGPKDIVEPPTNIPCEKCGRMLEIKWGRNGKFLACPAYKDDPPCKNTQNFEKLPDGTIKIVPKEEITTDQKCDKCSSPMVVKTGRFGKFIACSAYPQCKTTKPLALGVKCPQSDCGGDLVQKRTKKGRSFFACSNYPKCEYALWDRPIPKTCPTCQAPFLVEKVSKQDGRSVQCRNEECGYREAG
ncbi:MAG: DNA topoisomerase I [Nitrospira sp. HN-bin3]|jgi:DNA topoisomerase-1|uniref:type I DNA topoisomerase n=1 Tax=Nitrospira cf. moscoviensis SBR1015 TaxID=96242 RepID=UPI000A0A46F8|nr:type I DNA topoisomerase [Nitrospira cf. moscoviensis SBR1015]OQW35123.1 MAG: DNA topoisomerase I [Nitrospira sp. HN-bin3]